MTTFQMNDLYLQKLDISFLDRVKSIHANMNLSFFSPGDGCVSCIALRFFGLRKGAHQKAKQTKCERNLVNVTGPLCKFE